MRFLRDHVNHTGEACLIWPFGRSSNGAAQCWKNGSTTNAARVMCELAHGKPPTKKHQAAHSCGKGHEGCVNPMHIRWATVSENHLDKREHGTHNRMAKQFRKSWCGVPTRITESR